MLAERQVGFVLHRQAEVPEEGGRTGTGFPPARSTDAVSMCPLLGEGYGGFGFVVTEEQAVLRRTRVRGRQYRIYCLLQ